MPRAIAFLICTLIACAPAHAAARPAGAKKARDYVGAADQKRDRQGMYHFESGAYKVHTDVDKNLANDIASHMDEVYKEYSARLAGFKPNPYAAVKPNEKMPLYVLRRYKDYVELLRAFGVNAANSGGIFFRAGDRQSGLAAWVEGQPRFRMYSTLQHEGFHQFADARIMVGLPPWVNEGLAEYFGDAVMVNGKLLVGRLDMERIERMRRAIKAGETLPFKELMTMSNERWVSRVTSGDKASSLMYDSAWSVCYFLIHGGKRGGPLKVQLDGQWVGALEAYLLKLNNDFVKDPNHDSRPKAFELVFGNNLNNFETAWKAGLEKLEPDAWFTSLHRLQFIAAGIKLFHERKIEMTSWDKIKEQLVRYKFRTTSQEPDVASRGERKDAAKGAEQKFEFPSPAEVEFRPSSDPKLPPGLLIKNLSPNLLLTWTRNNAGELEEDISYVDPPRVVKEPAPRVPVAKKSNPSKTEANSASPARPPHESPQTQPAKNGTIKVGGDD